jgi:uncharacterized tellurite resistance protein B-like protein
MLTSEQRHALEREFMAEVLGNLDKISTEKLDEYRHLGEDYGKETALGDVTG